MYMGDTQGEMSHSLKWLKCNLKCYLPREMGRGFKLLGEST